MAVANDDLLLQIQRLQFTDRLQAEIMLRDFLAETFPLDISAVQLRPQVTSLNSFNGFMTLSDGKRLFFKTHAESDTVIGEYYQASMLASAGYPVLQPVYSSTEVGRQILIYEVIESPSVFEIARMVETSDSPTLLEDLTVAQHEADDHLLKIYMDTLEISNGNENRRAPIHQLFHHRIEGGRFERFYGGLRTSGTEAPTIDLPGGTFSMRQIRGLSWTINGQKYSESIDEIARRASSLLTPETAGPTVVGHGDAHNGNVFLVERDTGPAMMYFDPAFAGRHSPLLDLVKPLFHNVFAMWMYFPLETARDYHVKVHVDVTAQTASIEHNLGLQPVRRMFFRSKLERVLIPIMVHLRTIGQLPAEWRAYLKAALFCCPMLTMNLADSTRFPPEISALGLAMAVEMGSESSGRRSVIDATLDEVEAQL